MRLRRNSGCGNGGPGIAAALLIASLPLAAGPIDVTSQTTARLDTGDALFFTLATYGFGIDAAAAGLSPYPAVMSFSFVSALPGPAGPFDPVLETAGGAAIETSPVVLEFAPGQYQAASFSGKVSVMEGSLALSSALSQQLFRGPSALLVLENLGPSATFGLSSFSIGHDLTVSLYGGGLSTGAPVVQATLDDSPASGVPEPGSGWLLAGGGALCWTASTGDEACPAPEGRGRGYTLVIRRAELPPGRPTRRDGREYSRQRARQGRVP